MTTLQGTSPAVLPFVSMKRGKAPNYWCVPPVGDSNDAYAQAFDQGRRYAVAFIRYIRANPVHAGLLAQIMPAMDHADDSPAKGYRAGFIWHVGHLALSADADADMQAERDRYMPSRG